MTKKREKITRPFTMIIDDIIRSPRISSSEFRLYVQLHSYCAKTAAVPTCEVTKTVLAVDMRISVRGVTKLLRRLEEEKLISVTYDEKGQSPVYAINVNPPESICPEQFKGRKIKTAVTYIRESGGVRKFQRKTGELKTASSRRTGWPENPSPPAIPQADVEPPVTSPADSTHELQFIPEAPSESSTHELQFIPPMNSSSSRYIVKTESSLERPNGLIPTGHSRDLGYRNPSPDENLLASRREEYRVRRAAPNETEDIMAKPSKEQLEAERARLREQQKGSRDNVTDLRTAETRPAKVAQRAVSKSIEHSSGKLTPGKLYTRFRDAVQAKYPGAILARHTDGRYMAWGKSLIANFSEDHLNEMIHLIVLDYENITSSRIFFKFSGTSHPTYEQFQGNIDLLSGNIGIGIIALPSVRYSPYADDYAKRKAGTAAESSSEDPGKTTVDPIQAIRDQVNG